MTRGQRLAYWTLPSLLCLALYWLGLKAWFSQDDFAWLSLRQTIYSPHDFWRAMFAPMAQGTIRPWSERGFFLLFYSLFGLEALPFRIWVFLTQFANLALLASLTWRITKSRAAGFIAPILWLVNNSLSTAMSWTSSYNQVLCAFFLMLAFRLFVEYTETGKRKYYFWQWIVFLLGFGALEINVVYPALAFSFALFRSRKYLLSTIPMFAVSGAYAILHGRLAPEAKTGTYALHWDSGVFSTLKTYAVWAMGPARLGVLGYGPQWLIDSGTALLAAALIGLVLWTIFRREWFPAFCAAWFVVVLSPVLPLRDHVSDYYNTIPAIGLAMLGAWAMVEAWKSGIQARIAAVLLVAIYLASNATVTEAQTRWRYDRSQAVKHLVRGVERAHELHPGKIILLKGVRNDAFWTGMIDKPFLLLGIPEVYLTPGSETEIEAHPDLGDPRDFTLSEAAALGAFQRNQAVVYEAGSDRLRSITDYYSKLALTTWKQELPQAVDAGESLYSSQFGAPWYPIEEHHRWMPKQATVRLGGPKSPGQKLHLTGFAPEELFREGPVHLRVSADGKILAIFTLTASSSQFDLTAHMPIESVGRPETLISLEADRVYVPPGDGRALSVGFGKIRIQ